MFILFLINRHKVSSLFIHYSIIQCLINYSLLNQTSQVEVQEKFKDIKGIRRRKQKNDTQDNDKLKKDKMTNNELQSTTQNTKDLTRIAKTD